VVEGCFRIYRREDTYNVQYNKSLIDL